MSNGTYQCTICGKTGDDEVPACEHSPGHIHYDSGWLVPEKEVENLRAELAAAKAEVERVSKLYLEMRDGHEHVVHIMHADLDRHKRALEKCKEQRNVNIHGIDTREIDYIAGQYDEEISRILEGKE